MIIREFKPKWNYFIDAFNIIYVKQIAFMGFTGLKLRLTSNEIAQSTNIKWILFLFELNESVLTYMLLNFL